MGFDAVSYDSYTIHVQFPFELCLEGIAISDNYQLVPMDGGVPITIFTIEPIFATTNTGADGSVTPTTGPLYDTGILSDRLRTASSFDPSSLGLVGDYFDLTSPSHLNDSLNLRVSRKIANNIVEFDRPLVVSAVGDPISWIHKGGVVAALIHTTKSSSGKHYNLVVKDLKAKDFNPFFGSTSILADSDKPRLESVLFQQDGSVVVTFNQAMRHDGFLTSPSEYSITGPTQVAVEQVLSTAEDQVVLVTSGFGFGSYHLTINAAGTPHDLAGNPIDATFNQAVFTASPPLFHRSIFTDRGPISKPALTLQTGTQVHLLTYTTHLFGAGVPFTSTQATLLGGAFTANHVGLYVTIAGTQKNDGTYKIAGLVGAAPTATLNLQATFVLPDSLNNSSATTWKLFDPRNGQIADDPADVTVLINGSLVVPTAVVGLLGQIILPAVPLADDEVVVDYSWVSNPTVDFRRLNSREFSLNNWDHDIGHFPNPSQHNYRYRNTIIEPSVYGGVNMLAPLDQPLLRKTHYRAWERAYTATLNDPALLLLNSPTHRIAFQPLERTIQGDNVSYLAATLPESDSLAPWDRKGQGLASVLSEQLTVIDNTTGPAPTGNPIFWFRATDLSFPHVFAVTWRMAITDVPTKEGIFTGVSVGWANGSRAIVLGYLDDGTSKKIGFLKRGGGNDPSKAASWIGGLDTLNNPTETATSFDWSTVHSYRFFRSQDGVVMLFVDGGVSALLQVLESDLAFLEELEDPFDKLQGVFFGSLSRPAESTSVWDFVRFEVLPLNPEQNAPSIFVNYEANSIPEDAPPAWTPVGYHGIETILNSDTLLLDSYSATDQPTESVLGLVGGDFRGYTRAEPLLAVSSDVVVDVQLQLRSYTHGISPNSAMVAIDDGNRLVQLSFFPAEGCAKVSYPGRTLPQQATPSPWSAAVTSGVASMLGRTLNLADASLTDGFSYFFQDVGVVDSTSRIISSLLDYTIDFRVRVNSFTPDTSHFCGVNGDVFDGLRDIGLAFQMISGIPYVSFHSEGVFLGSGARFPFPWNDGNFHTYRTTKSSTDGSVITSGTLGVLGGTTFTDSGANFAGVVPGDELVIHTGVASGAYPILSVNSSTQITLTVTAPLAGSGILWQVQANRNHTVSIFADSLFIGTVNYDQFAQGPVGVPAVITFGSTTPASVQSLSNVDWVYFNVFRSPTPTTSKYVGFWKGTDPNSLTGYYLPLKTSGVAGVLSSTVSDPSADFVALGVEVGDRVVIDYGPNKGEYEVTGLPQPHTLAVSPALPVFPTQVSYRIPSTVDFTALHRYRIVRDSGGAIALFVDGDILPRIRVAYSEVILPPSSAGLPGAIQNGLPSISFGAFDPTNISQTNWDYVRYGITRSPSVQRIVPPHQALNQRNIMSSPEHLTGTVAHNHTQFSSSSTGVPYPWEDFVNNPAAGAFTKLNEGTPLVPSTQTYEVRRPTPVFHSLVGLNRPEDVLNDQGNFKLNDATTTVTLLVPNDVLYNSLQVIEQTTGVPDLLASIQDDCQPQFGPLFFQKEICLVYDGTVLPEHDLTASTPWTLVSETPGNVSTTASTGVLTYALNGGGGQTLYRNNTPLPDSIGLDSEVTFRLKLLNDSSVGLGDTGVRFGFSALGGLTAALAFVTTPLGDKEVHVLDLLANVTLGSIPFDFSDGAFHTYRLVKNVLDGTIDFFIDS